MASPTRNASTGFEPFRRRQQARHVGKRATRAVAETFSDSVFVVAPFAVAGPKQGCDAFEAVTGDQFLQAMAADDQPSSLAINFAHDGIGYDHAIEPTIHTCLQHLKIPFSVRREDLAREIYCQY